jgi:hypothetical protein
MKRVAVVSSVISSVGYDPSRSLLEIALVNHAIYQYRGVSADVFNEFMMAASHGKYYNEVIKSTYEFDKIK